MARAPIELSAILNMPGSYASIRKTIRHLCAQTAKDRLEVIIVTTPGKIQQINSSELAAVGEAPVKECAHTP